MTSGLRLTAAATAMALAGGVAQACDVEPPKGPHFTTKHFDEAVVLDGYPVITAEKSSTLKFRCPGDNHRISATVDANSLREVSKGGAKGIVLVFGDASDTAGKCLFAGEDNAKFSAKNTESESRLRIEARVNQDSAIAFEVTACLMLQFTN